MSRESARAFVESYGKDPAIEAAVKALPDEGAGSFEQLAQIAPGLGYDFTPRELAQEFHAHLESTRAGLEGEQMSDEELDEIAGGAKGDRPFGLQACQDDYNPNAKCWFNDRCYGMTNHYSRYGLCKDTYEPYVGCWFTDRCSADTNVYDCRYGD